MDEYLLKACKAIDEVYPFKSVSASKEVLERIREEFKVDIKEFRVTVTKGVEVSDDEIFKCYADSNLIAFEYESFSSLEREKAKVARLKNYLHEIFKARQTNSEEWKLVDHKNPVIKRVWDAITKYCDLIPDVDHEVDVKYMKEQRLKGK